jgi:hypothetical protein
MRGNPNEVDANGRLDLNTMQYFTPELLLQLNSTDEAVVDRAMKGWKKAVTEYKKAVREVGRQLPVQSRRVLELSLHDWKLVTIKPGRSGPARQRPGTLIMALEYRSHLAIIPNHSSTESCSATARHWSFPSLAVM